MADPEFERGIVFDADGNVDLLRSPCFDVGFEDDATIEDYLERVVPIVASVIDRRFSNTDCTINSRSLPSSSTPSTFLWIKTIGVATFLMASFGVLKTFSR